MTNNIKDLEKKAAALADEIRRRKYELALMEEEQNSYERRARIADRFEDQDYANHCRVEAELLTADIEWRRDRLEEYKDMYYEALVEYNRAKETA
jgi:ribosomal protein L22